MHTERVAGVDDTMLITIYLWFYYFVVNTKHARVAARGLVLGSSLVNPCFITPIILKVPQSYCATTTKNKKTKYPTHHFGWKHSPSWV